MSNKIGKSGKSYRSMRQESQARMESRNRSSVLRQSFSSVEDLRAAMNVQEYGGMPGIRGSRSDRAAEQIAAAMGRALRGKQPDGSYIDENGVRMSKDYVDNLDVTKSAQPGKGEPGGLCNRTACQAPGAYWYNHSTQKHYCGTCADLINRDSVKFKDSFLERLGHPLLTLDPQFADRV